ncbi:MAG TPA: aminoacyl-tRNA hydrolase [Methylomusa anaerophila]|uniref:Peptidyl-tRNA hydrolase n=1 Tax=Methylomusa anaerophila TaxID=1930071 RepID=A0A348AGV3_9FIRM|nr:aminoacyl-tRNA hydrolase [Methylomusa anaerophila]BBB90301.1 peptidyl-tRNA hydrolase [Methylomusa anaerophila]HML89354.1 aminoacyl-tRNA hydrolase [Methylomusa anaerophila]
MKIVAGLGNPGQEYSVTRHNVGFMAVDLLADRWGIAITSWREREKALAAEYRGSEPVLLVKPQTYMNLSGIAVGALARWYKIPVTDIIVIYDDLDLPVGKLRLRSKGGSGGHRGIESLLEHLGQDAFARIRVGIGRPPQGWETADYVLSRFTAEETPLIKDAITRAADAVECLLKEGFNKAMNKFNSPA